MGKGTESRRDGTSSHAISLALSCVTRAVYLPPLDADLSGLRFTIHLTTSRLDHMKPAFSLGKARPPTRPRIFSRPNGPRAMRAADAWIVLVMQRVVGHIVLMDVIPNLL